MPTYDRARTNPRGGTRGPGQYAGNTMPLGFGTAIPWGGNPSTVDAINAARMQQYNQAYNPAGTNIGGRNQTIPGYGAGAAGAGTTRGTYGGSSPASGSSPWDYFTELYDQYRKDQTARYNDILGGYNDRYARNMQRMEGAGQAGMADINRRFDELMGQQTGRLVDRGWGESTVADSLYKGIERERAAELARLQEDLAQREAVMDSSLSQDTLGFKERLDLTLPSMELLSQLAQQMIGGQGQGGYGTGIGGGGTSMTGGADNGEGGSYGAGGGGITNVGGDSGVVPGTISGLTWVSPAAMGYQVPYPAQMLNSAMYNYGMFGANNAPRRGWRVAE